MLLNGGEEKIDRRNRERVQTNVGKKIWSIHLLVKKYQSEKICHNREVDKWREVSLIGEMCSLEAGELLEIDGVITDKKSC